MLTVAEALDRMLAAARPLPAERVPLAEALGRVLAEDVRIDHDLPPFDKSAVDGWACRRSDLGGSPGIAGRVAAGELPGAAVVPGTCVKVMTGAPLPPGTECVVMVEHAREEGGRVVLPADSAANLCRRGEDLRAGARILPAGAAIGPAAVGVLATAGCGRPLVARRPRVAVIPTGSELVGIDRTPTGAAIRDSNGWQIEAQVRAMGGEARRRDPVPDRAAELDAAVAEAMAWADVVVLSGGVSAGDFDLGPGILRQRGFALRFEGVAMQPGKPLVFGDDGTRWCVGLPGNPVSTFVVAELMLRPFLLRLMGSTQAAPPLTARLGEGFSRRKADRQATIPVAFTAPGVVAPVDYHGSAHLDALCRAHALATIPLGVRELPAGSEIHVRPL